MHLHPVEQRSGDRLGDVAPSRRTAPRTGRGRRRGSGRGRCGSARGRAPRAAPRDGSPRQSAPTLSISSSIITGFFVPASFSARTIRPGSAPTYVRRWPRISASSCTPPSETRTNFRPSARATDSPSEVLPTPGGPTSVRIAPDPRPVALGEPALRAGACGPPGTRRSGPSRPRGPSWSASRTRRASAMSRLSSVRTFHGSSVIQSRYVRIHPYSGDCSEVRSEPAELALGLLADVVGHPGLRRSSRGASRPRPQPSSSPSSLADRRHLLAQDQLALALLEALADLVADLAPSPRTSASVSFAQREHQLQAALDVDRLEDLDLPLEARGRASSRPMSRDLPGIVDPAEELGDRRASPRASTMLSIVARYSRASVSARSDARLVRDRLELDPRRLAGAGHADADRRRGAGRGSPSASVPPRRICRGPRSSRSSRRGVAPRLDARHEHEQAVVVVRSRGVDRRPWPRATPT